MRVLDPELAWYGGNYGSYEPPHTEPPDSAHRYGPHAKRGPQEGDKKRQRVGIVLGRFRPPHRGHQLLVEHAFAECGLLYVISPYVQRADARQRQDEMLRAAFADWAEVHLVQAPSDPKNVLSWEPIVKDIAPHATHMFSSDRGAAPLATKLNVAFEIVDPDRSVHHVCATDIRSDFFGMFRWIVPPVRRYFAIHVGLLGPESAGKTTLAHELRSALGATVVDDRLREIAEQAPNHMPTHEQLDLTLSTSLRMGREAMDECESGVVVNDNTALQIAAWGRRLKFPLKSRAAESSLELQRCDLWLLCHDDFGFVGSPERDQPLARKQMLDDLRAQLEARRVPRDQIVEIRGEGMERVEPAVRAIRALMERRALEYRAQLE